MFRTLLSTLSLLGLIGLFPTQAAAKPADALSLRVHIKQGKHSARATIITHYGKAATLTQGTKHSKWQLQVKAFRKGKGIVDLRLQLKRYQSQRWRTLATPRILVRLGQQATVTQQEKQRPALHMTVKPTPYVPTKPAK